MRQKKMLLFKGHLSQHTYDFSAAGSDYAPLVCHPLATRRMQPQAQLKDCVPQDLEELKMITHDSGIRVIFTNEQKLGQIRNAIATDGQFRNVDATAGSSENVNA